MGTEDVTVLCAINLEEGIENLEIDTENSNTATSQSYFLRKCHKNCRNITIMSDKWLYSKNSFALFMK